MSEPGGDQPGFVGMWRLVTGALLTFLTATALAGVRFTFDTARELVAMQRDLEAINRDDVQQRESVSKLEARLDRAMDRIRALEIDERTERQRGGSSEHHRGGP